MDFAGFDAVLLLNVRELGEAEVTRLRAFVEAGGGLFMSLGDQVDADTFNARLGQLSPRPLRLIKTAVPPGSDERERRAARLASVDLAHPALDVFAGQEGEGLLTAHFFRYFLLEAGPEGARGQTLASFDDGAPALIARELGKGRVLLFTSTVDRAWTDLPIRTGFLPLMQRLTSFLARALEVAPGGGARRVGEVQPFPLPLAGEVRAVEVPGGEVLPVAEASATEGASARHFTETRAPGLYAARGGQGEDGDPARRLPRFDFAVNVDPSESDLARHEVAELRAWFGGGSGSASVTRRTVDGGSDAGEADWPLASLLLIAALACFTAECLLLRR